MGRLHNVLIQVQDDYSSPDPSRRTRGVLGKILVEEGLAFLISLILILLAFGVEHFLDEIQIFTSPIRIISAFGSLLLFWGYIIWCEIILDLREYESSEE